jgi:uncharacterized protein
VIVDLLTSVRATVGGRLRYRSFAAMKTQCEKCGAALGPGQEARVCSYECTFCPACSTQMGNICPNCGGRLVPRKPQP